MNDKPKELEEHSAQIFEFGCMERPVYLKEDVDAVIAELKRKLQDQCISCPVKMQEDDVVSELEKKLEDAKATAYAESVDAGMENRRLKRALYNLRACYADMMQKRYIECKTDGWVHRVNKWIEVERRCFKKAEEYNG